MPSRAYHEAVWEAVPEGLEPSDFALRRRFLLEHAQPGELLLDVGCGEGVFASELLRAGTRVVGIDVAAEPLRRARERDPALDLRLVEEGEPWPLPDGGFDAVWAGETIEHVADTGGWLSQVRRVLRPQGRLLLSTPNQGRVRRLAAALSGRAFERDFDPLSEHLRFYTRTSLSRLLESCGFQEVRVLRAGGPPAARRVLLAAAVRARW
jgi:2-polyprenyl-3-methyl-5-hydroxy-6-metoxy-1,4-benzoquinol methylase